MATFQDIIGQEQMKEHLMNAVKSGKTSHAYMIQGERSSGKEFIARVFAMALQCESRAQNPEQVEPCNECHACKQALSENQPDIIRVTHEKPNTIGVEDIRTQINQDIIILEINFEAYIFAYITEIEICIATNIITFNINLLVIDIYLISVSCCFVNLLCQNRYCNNHCHSYNNTCQFVFFHKPFSIPLFYLSALIL